MNRPVAVLPVIMASSLIAAVPVAEAAPACPTAADGGAQNFATVLRDVRVESFDDLDRITFMFGPSARNIPHGPVGDWQVPQFTVSQPDKALGIGGTSSLLVDFRGAVAHDTDTTDQIEEVYGPTDITTPAEFPVLARARQLKDADDTVVWALGLKVNRCPDVYTADIPPRAVIDLPH